MMRILLAGLFFWTSAVHAGPVKKTASQQPTKNLSQILKEAIPGKKTTIAELTTNLEKMQLSPDYIQLIRQKNAGSEKQTIEFDVVSPNRFVFRSEGNEVVFEFITKGDDHQIKINNRLIDIDPYASLDATMLKIEKMIGNKSARNPLLNLLLPEAQAFWSNLLGIAAVGLGVWGIYTNYKNCGKYEDYVKECRKTGLTDAEKASLKNKLSKMQGWFTKNLLSTMCSYKNEANHCYEKLQNETTTATGLITPGTTTGVGD